MNRPGWLKAASRSAAIQTLPLPEPRTTGCWAATAMTPPTASQPSGPKVTLVSCWTPGRSSTAGVWPLARVQELPPFAEVQAAG